MTIENFISGIYFLLGVVCLFRPVLFLYLFISIPLLELVPIAIADTYNLKLFTAGSINIFVQDYLIFLMAFYFLILMIMNKKKLFSSLQSPLSKIAIIFFIWEIFICFLSYEKGFEFQNILRNLSVESLLFLLILVPLIGPSHEQKEKFFRFSILMGAIVIIFALLKYAVFHEMALTSSETRRTLAGNAVLILIFPLCYALFYSDFWRRHGFLSLFLVLSVAVGIHFAGHRSGWIVFAFIVGVWFILHEGKIDFIWVPLWSLALILMLIMSSFTMKVKPGTLYGDFMVRIYDTFNMENKTTQERLSKWKYSIAALEENPLLGLGRFPIYTSNVGEENKAMTEIFSQLNQAPHNIIAEKAVHEGLLGLGMLTIFFIVVFRQLQKSSHNNRRYFDFFRIFVIAFIIFSFFNTSFSDATGRIFLFILLGLLNMEIIEKIEVNTQFQGERR